MFSPLTSSHFYNRLGKTLMSSPQHNFPGSEEIVCSKWTYYPGSCTFLKTLPVKIYGRFLFQIRSEFGKFLWAGKAHRINHQLLMQPKILGSIGLPDVHKYHRATTWPRCHLHRMPFLHRPLFRWLEFLELSQREPSTAKCHTAPWKLRGHFCPSLLPHCITIKDPPVPTSAELKGNGWPAGSLVSTEASTETQEMYTSITHAAQRLTKSLRQESSQSW